MKKINHNKKELIIIIVSAIFLGIAVICEHYFTLQNKYLWLIVYIPLYLFIGGGILKKAIRNIFKGQFLDECFLMTIATLGALIIASYPEAVLVMILYRLGELFQDYAVNKSRKSIADLMDLRPDIAIKVEGDQLIEMDPFDLEIDDIIMIKPGEKIAVDCSIIEGESTLNTAPLTGESLPQDVIIGDKIYSGCINLTGIIKAKVINICAESTATKIIDMVENASSNKSKSEKFITKFAKYYTPTVVFIACLVAILPPFIIGIGDIQIWSDWIYRALNFLVVSCPCAIVISVPLAYFTGIGWASKNGILVKGGDYLEALSSVECAVFDKTGTLTKGNFQVVEVVSVDNNCDKLIELCAYCEQFSSHPIAQAIVKYYGKKFEKTVQLDIQELAGYGIRATMEDKIVLVGNAKLLQDNNIDIIESENIGTILYMAKDSKYLGYIRLADEIKEDSKLAINKLHNMAIKTIMLSGDKRQICDNVAQQLDIDKAYSQLLPQEKIKILEELKSQRQKDKKIVFIGDGINDAPAMMVADIGISMGGIGSDATIEASDVVFMKDSISSLPKSIEISKKTRKIALENIIGALAIKVVVLILSLLGLTQMWLAIWADVGVSIIAILNSMRLLIKK